MHPQLRRIARGISWRIKYRYRESTKNLFIDMCNRQPVNKFSLRQLNEVQRKLFSHVIEHSAYRVKLSRPQRIESISVVIPHYNQQAVIGETIESILGQSLPPHEIIIVDDSSADRALTRAETERFLRTGKVKVLYPNEKLYPGGARELGSRTATGDILQFFDADDIMHPQRLELVRDVFRERDDAWFVVAGFKAFSGNVPIAEPIDLNSAKDAVIPPRTVLEDMAAGFSKSRLSFVDPKTNEVPWYAWGGFGARETRHGCCAGNPAILSPCRDLVRWNSPKKYVFTPYEDLEYCTLLLALTKGVYHLDLPLTYYRRGYTTSMPLKELS